MLNAQVDLELDNYGSLNLMTSEEKTDHPLSRPFTFWWTRQTDRDHAQGYQTQLTELCTVRTVCSSFIPPYQYLT